MKSVMSHSFSQVPSAEIQRSRFDRSHGCKTTFDSGILIPIFVDEVLPGDTFNCRTSCFARLSTPIYPVMDNMHIDTHYFAVPLRLVWDNFQKMMGEQENPGDSTDYLIPQIVSPPEGYAENSLYDYMGIPTKVGGLSHSALPIRAYNLIYNEWFRDQNLQNSVSVDKRDGPDDYSAYYLLRRGKRHDYFTSCLPWPQKGDSVDIPIGQTAPVVPGGTGLPVWNAGQQPMALMTGPTFVTDAQWNQDAGSNLGAAAYWDDPALEVDLSSAVAATVNQLRQAFQVQKMYERDARGGTRYTEIIRSHFNVVSPDMRLQRPELLGVHTAPINITPIAQTTDVASVGGQGTVGELGAMGTISFSGHGFNKSFVEHSIVIGLASVRADLTYQNGINRMWTRKDKLDFYWPALAHIGEQAVLSKEIYADGTPQDEAVFGYQERYAEYRYKPSTIHGLFRSNASQSLDTWHLSQDFESRPSLSETFMHEVPPIDRVVAVPSEPQFIADFYHKLICARPMPMFGVPGNIDRF